MAITRTLLIFAVCCCATALTGCGDDDDTNGGDDDGDDDGTAGTTPTPKDAGDTKDSGKETDSGKTSVSQTPPMGIDAIDAWLAKGEYKQWACEDDVHASRSPSPHGFNRICSNDIIADNVGQSGEWPKGASAVKELYASESDDEPMGYSVYLKTESDSDDGDNWYWYEQVPSNSTEAHDDAGIAADGLGNAGAAESVCVTCHAAAGTDSAHKPSPNSRDFVYTPVR